MRNIESVTHVPSDGDGVDYVNLKGGFTLMLSRASVWEDGATGYIISLIDIDGEPVEFAAHDALTVTTPPLDDE